MTAKEARIKLEQGNRKYLEARTGNGDISREIRKKTAAEGQSPYAVIVACSDSRVIPEAIFSAGIGELFVIRVAGNVIDHQQLGSIEYAVGHLGAELVVVLGHTGCGAVGAAMSGRPEGYIRFVTDEILKAIGTEKNAYRACCLNVRHSCEAIRESFSSGTWESESRPEVVGAVYCLESGAVEFLDENSGETL